ncbi:MAG: RNA methyltransferase [Bacteroidetes bacterium]|nr:RNA methyltransferase [Bacteroidia bacterium]MBN8697800.1 RNA methyltransferase [Bacteroidota bacterium]MCK6649612.1 RNA methyltransferase [Bacteroidia bacterium]
MRKLKNEELGRKTVEEFKEAPKTPVIIVLDNVRSLNNVGSVFRTADAFLIEAVYLCGITGTPPNKEIQKTALGATESIAWKYFKNTMDAVEELKQQDFLVYAVEQAESAIMLNNFMPSRKQKIAIIFGNEVKGVAQDVIDASTDVIEIPQVGTKHSLNIAVSVGIVMWDLYLKIK